MASSPSLIVVCNCKACRRPLYDGPRRASLIQQAVARETSHLPQYAYLLRGGYSLLLVAGQNDGYCARCYSRRLSDIPKEGLAFVARVADAYEALIAQLLRSWAGGGG